MLMSTINQSFQDLFGRTDQAQPIVSVPVSRPAANESISNQSEMQARRQRRARRMEGAGQGGNLGWTIRSW